MNDFYPQILNNNINYHFCSIEYNYNWNNTGNDFNSIFYYIKNKPGCVINKFGDILFSCYVNLIKHFDKNTMWQNFYAIKLSCKVLSNSISPLINYALVYIKKYKIKILPPNILSYIYPSISYSINNNKIIVPTKNDINKNLDLLEF